jgi:hypothetical protein
VSIGGFDGVAEKSSERESAVCYSGRTKILRRDAMAEPAKQQVQIKADERELLGQYSNVVVHHNAEEFTLNFVYVFPTLPQGKLVASLIMSPRHAKRLLRALEENVARYEAQFGTLPEGPGPGPEPNVGFIQ